jgi:hypothetical protein
VSEQLARLFHETYERLAPQFGYETRKASAVPWDQVPERNKALMIAVADFVEREFFQGLEAPDDAVRETNFHVENGYGYTTRMPFVALRLNEMLLAQMPPEDATRLAHNLLAAAESALGDAFLIEFIIERIGVEMPQAAGLIHEFREWRAQREEPSP